MASVDGATRGQMMVLPGRKRTWQCSAWQKSTDTLVCYCLSLREACKRAAFNDHINAGPVDGVLGPVRLVLHQFIDAHS